MQITESNFTFKVLKISGLDHISWLHGLCSTNLKGQTQKTVRAATLNTSKGKTIALVHIAKLQDCCLLLCPQAVLEATVQHLEKYLLSESVDIEVLPQTARLSLMPETSDWDNLSSETCFPSGWGSLSFSFANDPCSIHELEKQRILAGYPLPTLEYGLEDTLSAELGQAGLISYDKGCYLGQEVFARIRTYGRTNRLLSRVRFSGDVCNAIQGQPATMDNVSRGAITSCVFDGSSTLALAYLPSQKIEPGKPVSCQDNTGELITS